jgi:excinuclease ABC subunit C
MGIRDDLKFIPNQPGVYLMKDLQGRVLYVGKAASLRNRVRSYFQSARNLSPRIEQMVRQVDRVEHIVTASAVEALVLESNFIKEKRPRYNVRLRDDKQYPWVKVTWQETFPQVFITRRIKRDGSKYYGPYTDVGALRETLRRLRRIYPLRSCKYDLERERPPRPCLNFHIHRCLAPCHAGITPEAYREMVRQITLFLEGRQDRIAAKLTAEMQQVAAERDYERAAQLRDWLRDIEKVLAKQKMVSFTRQDTDIFGLARDDQGALIQVFQVRDGKLVGREYFLLGEGISSSVAETLEAFLIQYYDGNGLIPAEICLPEAIGEMELFAEYLSGQRGAKVTLSLPQRGEKEQLVRMANENAVNLLLQERHREKHREAEELAVLEALARELQLAKPPRRIECFDISNLQGEEAVASMAVFENGRPKGAEYRRFKIRTVQGPNDFAMLQEAVRRRFRKGLAERAEEAGAAGKFSRFPDLLLIDGGKGQLSAVFEVLAELQLTEIDLASLAKQEEEVFRPGNELPVRLEQRSEALKLLQRLRDEAHRFAITYHKSLRDKKTTTSDLDAVPGIGPRKKQALLKKFGSVQRIREASLEDLVKVPGVDAKLAQMIKENI